MNDKETILNEALVAPASVPGLRKISLRTLAMFSRVGINLDKIEKIENFNICSLGEIIYLLMGDEDEVLNTVYNAPSELPKRADLFLDTIDPKKLPAIGASIARDFAAISEASVKTDGQETMPGNLQSPQ